MAGEQRRHGPAPLDGRQPLAELSTPYGVAGDERPDPPSEPPNNADTDEDTDDSASAIPPVEVVDQLDVQVSERRKFGAPQLLASRAIGRTPAIERV